MADLLIRNVDETVLQTLKRRAEAKGTSLQHEAKDALGKGAMLTKADRRAVIDGLHRLWGERPHLSEGSVPFVRAEREENS